MLGTSAILAITFGTLFGVAVISIVSVSIAMAVQNKTVKGVKKIKGAKVILDFKEDNVINVKDVEFEIPKHDIGTRNYIEISDKNMETFKALGCKYIINEPYEPIPKKGPIVFRGMTDNTMEQHTIDLPGIFDFTDDYTNIIKARSSYIIDDFTNKFVLEIVTGKNNVLGVSILINEINNQCDNYTNSQILEGGFSNEWSVSMSNPVSDDIFDILVNEKKIVLILAGNISQCDAKLVSPFSCINNVTYYNAYIIGTGFPFITKICDKDYVDFRDTYARIMYIGTNGIFSKTLSTKDTDSIKNIYLSIDIATSYFFGAETGFLGELFTNLNKLQKIYIDLDGILNDKLVLSAICYYFFDLDENVAMEAYNKDEKYFDAVKLKKLMQTLR